MLSKVSHFIASIVTYSYSRYVIVLESLISKISIQMAAVVCRYTLQLYQLSYSLYLGVSMDVYSI